MSAGSSPARSPQPGTSPSKAEKRGHPDKATALHEGTTTEGYDMKQWIISGDDPSSPEGDVLVTVYDNEHLVACRRLDHTRWDAPLPVHALGGCQCGHRASDHDGACDLCDCTKLGGVR